MSLQQTLQQFFLTSGQKSTYWIAYSGGLDSQVLLMLCHTLALQCNLKLRVIHVNHGLSPQANAWQKRVEEGCLKLNLPLTVHHLKMTAPQNMEETARRLRYAFFADCMQEGDYLLTAHQQDDQAETLLLQLLRGAGPKGLASMPMVKPFAKGFHARPLLQHTRAELHDYAKEHHLEWIEDESNQKLDFARNYLRHQIMPPLKQQWPSITKTLARTAMHCAEAQLLLDEYAKATIIEIKNADQTLTVSKLKLLTAPMQRLVLRYWIEAAQFPLPDTKKLVSIQQILHAAWDAQALVQWQAVEVRKHGDKLYLLQQKAKPLFVTTTWDVSHSLVLSDGELKAHRIKGQGFKKEIQKVTVTFRQGGEKIFLAKRGYHTLKNMLQEWQVLPWERPFLPLIYHEQALICIPGYYIHPDYAVTADDEGNIVCLQHSH